MRSLSNEKNRRILVIDDNLAIHDDIRSILASGGGSTELQDATAALLGNSDQKDSQIEYEVDSAMQGQEGLAKVVEAVSVVLDKLDKLLLATKEGTVDKQLLTEVGVAIKQADVEYLREEIPQAINQSLSGVERVAKIVRAMKEFSHPGTSEKSLVSLNEAIETTATVARNEWKYVAEMVTEFDPELPQVSCLPSELNQVFLNLIVNAAHAIGDTLDDDAMEKGTITVGTSRDGEWVEISIADTGTGIPADVQARIFDPFFTTKEVGKGTGQGLAIARSVVVDKHCGTLDCESEEGKGTTFLVRLPIDSSRQLSEAEHASSHS